MKTVRVNIQNGNDRENMVIALANANISVRVEITEINISDKIYWVVFELPENNIRP